MLKVAMVGANQQGVLVNFGGTWILAGCPPDVGTSLRHFNINMSQVAAVLLTSGTCMEGWPLLRRSFVQAELEQPRLLGTEPMLQVAQSHLRDLAMMRPSQNGGGELFSLEEVEEAFLGAEEVSFGQEVLLEGDNATMLLKASCSGLGLGGSLWSLACYGLCVVVGASAKVARLPDLEALTVADVVVLLGGISRHPSRDVQQQLTDAAKEVAVVLQSRGNVLVPLNGSPEDFTEELTECIAKAISELENQGPIFAISTPARSLRRCGRWAEWTSKKGQDVMMVAMCREEERARVGEHPFLVDALRESGRLVLAETINDLTDAYEEPCVVLAPISLKRHFEKLWDSQKASRRLCWLDVQGVLPGVGNAIQPYISATELARTWSSCARPPKLIVPKGRVPLPPELTSCKAVELMVLDSGLLEVPLDLDRPRVKCWLPRDHLAVARKQGRKRPADVLPLHGTFIGNTRPRIAPRQPEAELLAGAVEVKAFQDAMRKAGLVVEGSGEVLNVPSLDARILLNQPSGIALETIVECKSADGRRRIAEVLDSVLMAL
ncbi:unnamed protein product [Durusdinium trenchii]|uniref:Metallo-beta-lactamase domain-containing protein n=2 Tax=Durusdinium trenchii TaxID=1381693 RepID=A0ABP0LIJ0_9DINO